MRATSNFMVCVCANVADILCDFWRSTSVHVIAQHSLRRNPNPNAVTCVVITDAETGEYDGDYWYFEDYGIVPKYHLKGDKMWRHVAFQFDEDTDMMRFFLDGALAMEGPSLVPVSEVDIDETKELYVNGQADFLKQLLPVLKNHLCRYARISTSCTPAACTANA